MWVWKVDAKAVLLAICYDPRMGEIRPLGMFLLWLNLGIKFSAALIGNPVYANHIRSFVDESYFGRLIAPLRSQALFLGALHARSLGEGDARQQRRCGRRGAKSTGQDGHAPFPPLPIWLIFELQSILILLQIKSIERSVW